MSRMTMNSVRFLRNEARTARSLPCSDITQLERVFVCRGSLCQAVVHCDRLCFDAGVTLDTEQSVVLSSLRNAGNLQLLLSWCLSPDQTPRNQARRMPSLKKQTLKINSEKNRIIKT